MSEEQCSCGFFVIVSQWLVFSSVRFAQVDVMRALGSEVVRTPTMVAHESPDSLFGVARRLQQTLPRAHILDQVAPHALPTPPPPPAPAIYSLCP